MDGVFTIDGALVKFSQLQLRSDGSRSDITGVVDTSRWPEQTWQVKSVVDFPRMREIFFAREKWVLGGEGHFTGVFHLFKGGRELKGDFTSAEAPRQRHALSEAGRLAHLGARPLRGHRGRRRLLRRPHAVHATASSRWGEPGVRPTASFDAEFDRVDLSTLGAAFEWAGHSARRRHVGLHEPPVAQRPLCREARRRQPDVRAARRRRSCAGRQLPSDAARARRRARAAVGPVQPGPAPAGRGARRPASCTWRLDPEWIDLAPSWMATARHVRVVRGPHRVRRALRRFRST